MYFEKKKWGSNKDDKKTPDDRLNSLSGCQLQVTFCEIIYRGEGLCCTGYENFDNC